MSATSNVFLLGAGRSGTKILRDCLGAASGVAAVPYDVGYIWRYGNEGIRHDELLPEHASPRTARFVSRALDRMALRVTGGPVPAVLIEKSVPNTLRPGFVATLFPQAKFVHIVRDGYAVIESALRNWQEPSDRGYLLDKLRYFPPQNYRYALRALTDRAGSAFARERPRLWGPCYDGMVEDARALPLIDVCARQWQRCVDVCDSQLAMLPAGRVLEIRYEDLDGGADVLREVCRFCGIEDVDGVLEFHANRFDGERLRRKGVGLSVEERRRVEAIAGPSMARYADV